MSPAPFGEGGREKVANAEVIPVKKDDTVHGLIQKIREAPASRVILFSDGRVPLLRNEINLRLLKFYSEEEEKTLILVIRDHAAKKAARRLGIKIDDSVEQRRIPEEYACERLPLNFNGPAGGAATSEDSRSVRPPTPLPGGKLTITLVFTFFTLLVGLCLIFYPRVTLIIHPVTQEWIYSVQGEAGINFSEREITQNRLPLRLLERRGEVSYTQATTGKKAVGFLPARGSVVFVNSGTNPVVVSEGVIVSTETGQKFVTTAGAIVPGKITQYELGIPTGEVYGRVEVDVEALEKGSVGNVEERTITRIEGPLARSLQVINLVPFTSGEDRMVAVVDEKDFLRAKEEVERQMRFRAEEDLKEMVEKDYILLPDLVYNEVESIKPDPQVGAEGEILNIKLFYRLRAGVLNRSTLYKWLQYNLQQTIPGGFVPVGEEIVVRDLRVGANDLRRSELYVRAAAKIRGHIDRQKVFQAIAGKTPEEARKELALFPEINRIEFRDANRVQTVPTRSFQVRLLVPTQK